MDESRGKRPGIGSRHGISGDDPGVGRHPILPGTAGKIIVELQDAWAKEFSDRLGGITSWIDGDILLANLRVQV